MVNMTDIRGVLLEKSIKFMQKKQAIPLGIPGENFQNWIIVQSEIDGDFRFKTIIPRAYDVGGAWTRPSHLHFRLISDVLMN